MSKKKLTVKLLCSFDNGEIQVAPGKTVSLPENQANRLVSIGAATVVTAEPEIIPPAVPEQPDIQAIPAENGQPIETSAEGAA